MMACVIGKSTDSVTENLPHAADLDGRLSVYPFEGTADTVQETTNLSHAADLDRRLSVYPFGGTADTVQETTNVTKSV